MRVVATLWVLALTAPVRAQDPTPSTDVPAGTTPDAAPPDATPPDATPAAPSAEALEHARSLFGEGLARADEQRWGEAVEYFRQALDIAERPSIVFNLAVALFRLGRTLEAREAFERYLAVADASADAAGMAEAQAFLAEIDGTIGVLLLHLSPPTAIVIVDGVVVPGEGRDRALQLDPGPHSVHLSADRRLDTVFEVSVLPGARAEREITLPWPTEEPAHISVAAPEGISVFLDDDRVGRGTVELEIDPGEHVVRIATTPERRIAFSVAPGESRNFTLEDSQRLETESGDDTLTWVLVGTGIAMAVGVGLGVGIWAGTQPNDPWAGYGGDAGVVIRALSF